MEKWNELRELDRFSSLAATLVSRKVDLSKTETFIHLFPSVCFMHVCAARSIKSQYTGKKEEDISAFGLGDKCKLGLLLEMLPCPDIKSESDLFMEQTSRTEQENNSAGSRL